MARSRKRYAVMFSPVGWQVIDREATGDPLVAEFFHGKDEYQLAKDKCNQMNDGVSEPCLCERRKLDPVAPECRGPNTCIDRWRETIYGDRLEDDEHATARKESAPTHGDKP